MNENIRAIVAVKSNEMRDALRALLESVQQISTIYQVRDELAITKQTTTHQPTLVLVDFDLFDAMNKHPKTILIALVDSREEYDYVQSRGAKWVFMKGSPVSQLVSIIDSILTTDTLNGEDR